MQINKSEVLFFLRQLLTIERGRIEKEYQDSVLRHPQFEERLKEISSDQLAIVDNCSAFLKELREEGL